MPVVSVGLPVRNGEKYLAAAIDSILAQTLADLELIICDNASTDATQAICLEYAQRDRRVRYQRQTENVGAAANFNLAFELATSPHFKWVAADDVLEPEFLERCVGLLEREPELIAAGSRYVVVDEISGTERATAYDHDLRSPRPSARLRKLFRQDGGQEHAVWCVVRSAELRETGLFHAMVGGDLHFVVDLVLKGPIGQLPDYLNRLRVHDDAYSSKLRRQNASRDGMQGAAEAGWWRPDNRRGATLPHWRLLRSYMGLFVAASQPWHERAAMLACLVTPIATRWRVLLVKELLFAAGLGPVYVAARSAYRWVRPGLPSATTAQGPGS